MIDRLFQNIWLIGNLFTIIDRNVCNRYLFFCIITRIHFVNAFGQWEEKLKQEPLTNWRYLYKKKDDSIMRFGDDPFCYASESREQLNSIIFVPDDWIEDKTWSTHMSNLDLNSNADKWGLNFHTQISIFGNSLKQLDSIIIINYKITIIYYLSKLLLWIKFIWRRLPRIKWKCFS